MIEYETVPPSKGGCWLCWCDERRGMLVKDDKMNVWVHQQCLDWFGIDDVIQYERQQYDL